MSVLIAGGGEAAVHFVAELRRLGYGEAITIVSDEPGLPYQRPPLSKGVLRGEVGPADLIVRDETFFAGLGVEVVHDRVVAAMPPPRGPGSGVAVGSSGRRYRHSVLALAHGGFARRLDLDASGPEQHVVRTLADAQRLGDRLRGAARRVGVVGGGFIGLEVAAVARSLGHEVTVVEQGESVMSRAVSVDVAASVAAIHGGQGIELVLGADVRHVQTAPGGGTVIRMPDRSVVVDELVVGIGLEVDGSLAAQCDLEFDGGVVTDEHGATAHPRIVAFGDCSAQRPAGSRARPRRIESVANATDQAIGAAAVIVGRPRSARPAPWFWSDQGQVKLQMVGGLQPADQCLLRGDPASGAFGVLHLRGGVLVGGEFLNRAGDALAARRLVGAAARLDPVLAADPDRRLRDAVHGDDRMLSGGGAR
ncbi:NAD(P)/FAD-dependent oxidoreductase [Nocardioides sp. L-11A]|uniref:NAD(P)/FAD-dependent oxidoreductase n=1 Tax=Nocardioides sp. L-11A TaxID=3043848 RepID=UPI00249BA4C4|nr:FAD-dependent oxidoreductase [Nocardioides sp. L-11A]